MKTVGPLTLFTFFCLRCDELFKSYEPVTLCRDCAKHGGQNAAEGGI